MLALSGLVCAMAIVLESMPIYLLGPQPQDLFQLPGGVVGVHVLRPLVGMAVGGVIDSVGFLLAGYGEPYFPGYLITAILSGLIYGVMLYQPQATVPRLLVTRLIINYGSNVLLGSVWKAMLYGKGYLYYVSTGLVKKHRAAARWKCSSPGWCCAPPSATGWTASISITPPGAE